MKGDSLELASWGLFGGDRRAAFAWALTWLGLSSETPAPLRSPPRPLPAPDREADRTRAFARWHEAEADLWRTPAGRYLAGRGLTEALGPLPRLRFMPTAWHSREYGTMPAMAAAITEPAGRFIGLHLTFVELAGGVWRKASIRPAKKIQGQLRGGLVELRQGASGRRLSEAPKGDRALLGEGLENVLTGSVLAPERRAIATLSCVNLPAIELPPALTDLVLVVDNDGENDAVRRVRGAALARWRRDGRNVELWETPDFEDMNEALLRLGGEPPFDRTHLFQAGGDDPFVLEKPSTVAASDGIAIIQPAASSEGLRSGPNPQGPSVPEGLKDLSQGPDATPEGSRRCLFCDRGVVEGAVGTAAIGGEGLAHVACWVRVRDGGAHLTSTAGA